MTDKDAIIIQKLNDISENLLLIFTELQKQTEYYLYKIKEGE